MGSVREILQELDSDKKWESTVVCLASSCDEPSWAREWYVSYCSQQVGIGVEISALTKKINKA
jgi:hypothetical protein